MTFADSSCINYMKCLTFPTAGYYFLLKTIHHLIQIHIAIFWVCFDIVQKEMSFVSIRKQVNSHC